MEKERIIQNIITNMSNYIDKIQLEILSNTLTKELVNVKVEIESYELSLEKDDNVLLLNNFLICKKINGILETSLKSYRYTIQNFFDWTNKNVRDIDTNQIRAYILSQRTKGNSMTSCDNTRRQLNVFFEWLVDENYIEKNPCRKLPRFKEPKKVKKMYSELDMEKLRDACTDKRQLALIDLLLCTGIRIGEIGLIKISDCDFENAKILINGKGNKQRWVYLSTRAKKHILEYIEEREDNMIYSEYLFCRNKAPFIKKMSNGAVHKMFKEICDKAGVKCTVHCLRRYVATKLVEKEVPVNIVSDLLGHSSTAVTMRYYVNVSSEKSKEIILKNIA